jgi:hypothetical protein
MLINVEDLGRIQEGIRELDLSLDECIRMTEFRVATDCRDRVLGLLGMVDSTARLKLQDLDYSCSLGKIFQLATEHMIEDSNLSKSLRFLGWHQGSGIHHPSEPGVPSWVLWMDNNPLIGFGGPFGTSMKYGDINRQPVTVSQSVIEAFGFVVDVDVYASYNLSKENFGSQWLDITDQLVKPSVTTTDPDPAFFQFRQAVELTNHSVSYLSHINSISRMTGLHLERGGVPDATLEGFSKLGLITKDNPLTKDRFPDEAAADLDAETLRDEKDGVAK